VVRAGGDEGPRAKVSPIRLDGQGGGPALSDAQLVDQVRSRARDEGAMPSRERIRIRHGVGTGRADRVRAAVLTGPTDEQAVG
jgi:hypothetical protein